MNAPERIADTAQLEELLSVPSAELVAMMERLDGDLMILGIAGKMGVTMGRLALRAIREAGVTKRVIGVARFSHPEEREKLRSWGVETIACDLLDREAVRRLPRVRDIIFMAGRKFGTAGSEAQTWAMNVLAPAYVAAIIRNESSFQPRAESAVGARGLMQLMPDTAEWIAHKLGVEGYAFERMYDPASNIRFGCWYLNYLSKMFLGNPVCVTAAYHAGQGQVKV